MIACLAVVLVGCPGPGKPETASAAPTGPLAAERYPMTVTDDFGEAVTLKGPPQRIVSMSPPLTESLFALGLGERVVGVTGFCDFPPEAKSKAKIGGVIDPSEEKIVSLAPDLVLAAVGNPKPILESLRSKGINVFSVESNTWSDVLGGIETVGKICDVADAAAQVMDRLRGAEKLVRERVAGIPEDKRPQALFIVWPDPLHVAGPNTYINDMVSICGAVNVAAQTENPWKQYSVEMAVAANPDVMVMIDMVSGRTPGAAETAEMVEELRANPQWKTVAAVKEGRVGLVNADLVSRSGPRLEQGLLATARIIHPDLFPEAGDKPASQ